jgi:hypothetical protein
MSLAGPRQSLQTHLIKAFERFSTVRADAKRHINRVTFASCMFSKSDQPKFA